MKLVIASDFSGFQLKEAVKKHLMDRGHEVTDVGQQTAEEKLTYVDAAANLAGAFAGGKFERGFAMCGTGAGVGVALNKYKGIYCVPCESLFTAPKSAEINHANILAMGAKVVTPEMACEMADAWLKQGYCEGFTPERRAFIDGMFQSLKAIENENFK